MLATNPPGILQLSQNGAKFEPGTQNFSIRLASGEIFGGFPFPPDASLTASDSATTTPVTGWAAQHALNAAMKLDFDSTQVSRNGDLSTQGREKAMVPIHEAALKTIGGVWQDFSKHKAATESAEAARYTVPLLERTDVVGFLREREIRDYARTMDRAKLAAAIQSAGDDPELVLSVLRSPVKFAEVESFAWDHWRQGVDQRDPMGLATLQAEKKSIDWAEHVMGAVSGRLSSRFGWSRGELYEKATKFNAAGFFGFVPAEIVAHKRLAEATRR